MEDRRWGARESARQHDLEEALREQALLWDLVDALTHFHRLTLPYLDAVLAGHTPVAPFVPAQRRRAR